MIRACEKCWVQFDNKKEGAGFFFCSKCSKKLKGREENGEMD